MFLWLSVLSLLSLGTAYKELSDSFLRAIPSPGYDIDPRNGSLLAPLLIPRVPGTPGQTVAQQHLFNFFRSELPKWDISWQNSTSTTPVSGHIQIPFANLIVKREPPWVKPGQANLLTLVAHYDSKYMPKGFVGATDSAAPCAMLMHVAKVVDTYVSQMYDEMAELGEGGSVEMDMGVQILFLDGEEAFEKWSDTDSLYGSRYAPLLARRVRGELRVLMEVLGHWHSNGPPNATQPAKNSTNTVRPSPRSPSSYSSTSSALQILWCRPTSPPHTGPTCPSPKSNPACARSTSSRPHRPTPSSPTTT